MRHKTNLKCKVSGCEAPYCAHGFCASHHGKWHRREKAGKPNDILSLLVKIPTSGPKGERNVNWKGGISEYPDHYTMKKVRLEKLKETRGKCELCGAPAKEIHHLDKTRNNHTKSNIIIVCHKCHMGRLHYKLKSGKRWTLADAKKSLLRRRKLIFVNIK